MSREQRGKTGNGVPKIRQEKGSKEENGHALGNRLMDSLTKKKIPLPWEKNPDPQ